MKDTVIQSVTAEEVIVSAKPGSLNSETVIDRDKEFARKFMTGGSWTEFADQPKWIIQITLKNGVTGIGETYRSASKEILAQAVRTFAGKDILKLNWRKLPVTDQRIYEAFEMAVLDAAGKTFGVPVYQLLGGSYRDRIACNGWTGRRTPEDAAQK